MPLVLHVTKSLVARISREARIEIESRSENGIGVTKRLPRDGIRCGCKSLPPAARALVAKQLVSRRAFRKILPWTDEFLMAAV